MSISYRVIGNHLRKAREQMGFTQAEIAERLDISTKHYGHIERGNRPVSLDVLGLLCSIYGVSLEQLISGALTNVPRIEKGTPQDTAIARMCSMMQGCSAHTLTLLSEIVESVTRYEKE